MCPYIRRHSAVFQSDSCPDRRMSGNEAPIGAHLSRTQQRAHIQIWKDTEEPRPHLQGPSPQLPVSIATGGGGEERGGAV